LFSILGARIAEARVLDLFAGSGALGFESLSRGADAVTFVESHRLTASALARTAASLDVAERCTIITAPAERAVTRLTGRYDIVFADPPYALPFPALLFARLRERGVIDERTLIVYEHSAQNAAPSDPALVLVRSARYGAVAIALLTPAA
jgi:16S rRNA (guanine966-N2)-methyltransferase